MTDDAVVFTIGHGDASFSEIEAHLSRRRVQILVDVRSRPYSSHAVDFNKQELEIAATTAGMSYRWLGDRLGGKPDDAALLTPSGEPDADAIRGSAGFAAAIDELLGLAAGARVAILCAERNPEHCHRSSIVAPALEAHGLRVWHILDDGSLRPHQSRLDI